MKGFGGRQPSSFVSVQPPREHTTLKGGNGDAGDNDDDNDDANPGDEKPDDKDGCNVKNICLTNSLCLFSWRKFKN